MNMNYTRYSRYMPGHDGTKIAVDLYLPETEEKVPFLLKAGYGKRRDQFEQEKEAMERFLSEGYAIAIVEMRGSGASFGVSDGFFGLHDGKDLACITDTLAKEDWCSGSAGTYGGSNYGMSQEINILEQPEALKASLPCDCSMDLYDQNYPNGVSAVPDMNDPHRPPMPEPVPEDPVDEDPEGTQLQEALKSRSRNLPFLGQYFNNMFRDDVHPVLGYRTGLEIPVWEHMDKIRHGHVKVWSLGAWYDPGCTNKILTYKSWGGRLLIGPWPHCGIYRNMNFDLPNASYDWVSDHLRFFDQYLKGKDSNISEEPPVRYYTVGDTGDEWKYDDDFPVMGTRYADLHLNGDHTLSEKIKDPDSIDYKVRDDIMIYDRGMRMNRNVEKDMTPEDQKSLVFTSDVLPEDMEITGIPSMDLFVKSTHTDGNFIAVLEEITKDGISHFLTEGVIRASHAKTFRNPTYESLGLPYHRGYREDAVKIPPVESNEIPLKLSFHLEALSRVIKKGSRLQISISCGGSGYQMPEGFPKEEMPVITLFTGEGCDSKVTLPCIRPWPTKMQAEDGTCAFVFRNGLYIRKDGKFTKYPVKQIYPAGKIGEDKYHIETEDFTAELVIDAGKASLRCGSSHFTQTLKERYVPENASMEIPVAKAPWSYYPEVSCKDLYVATVPVNKGRPGNMNPMQRTSFDLFIDLIYPEESCDEKGYPVIVDIHGFGGNHHQFERNTPDFLKAGYAVASIDYRLTPPCTWDASVNDAKGCIRYLKAHAEELKLNKNRIGIMGGSMGGYLTGMIASTNGDPEMEGNIGGNTGEDSSVCASLTGFGPMDLLTFGDDCEIVWPGRDDKRANGDGPFAPPASMIDYVGIGKGVSDLKRHLNDPDPEYRRLLAELKNASPISHVTENSAPICLYHGMFECGIQVPMGQSIRMFDAYYRKGAKALLLCNTNGLYGEDPEIRDAMIRFLKDRV